MSRGFHQNSIFNQLQVLEIQAQFNAQYFGDCIIVLLHLRIVISFIDFID